ncbi:MAG: hypothetical protein F6J95_030690 [Leptolyngbya sp. SIO1E4]|nr:hypothetical protein [Leptolyngbya sp. SIO1E4]
MSREYLDYLISRMTDDQTQRLGLGIRNPSGINEAMTLNSGTYVWEVDNRYINSYRFKIRIRHAASGRAGEFRFIAFEGSATSPKVERLLGKSGLMTRSVGQISTWDIESNSERLWIGVEIPNDNTSFYLAKNAPLHYRGLDPLVYEGPINVNAPQLQQRSESDGLLFPAFQIEPQDIGESGLSSYYHTNFQNDDTEVISLTTFCVNILVNYLTNFPGGQIDYLGYSEWQANNADNTERDYLDYLLARLTQPPMNMPDLDALPERLSERYQTNFVAPETIQGSQVEFLIALLQRDLSARKAHFKSYQEWENQRLQESFPENYYPVFYPLTDQSTYSLQEISSIRNLLPQNHPSQSFMDVMERGLKLDNQIAQVWISMSRGELKRAYAKISEAEQSLTLLLRQNSRLLNPTTLSQWIEKVELEKKGEGTSQPLQQRLEPHIENLISKDMGSGLLAVTGLQEQEDVSILLWPPTLNESPYYVRRKRREKEEVSGLINDIRLTISREASQAIFRLKEASGNYQNLNSDDQNFIKRLIVSIWYLVPHYMFYLLPIAYAELYRNMGQHELACLYYQFILNHEKDYTSQMVNYSYLNNQIELPFITLKSANNLVDYAESLIRDRSQESRIKAELLYQNAERFINLNVDSNNPRSQQLLNACNVGRIKIKRNLNSLGYSEDFFPIFRYSYLISLADELVKQAVDSSRQFSTFMQQAEQASRGELESNQVVAINDALVAVEQLKLRDVEITKEIAHLQRDQTLQEIDDLTRKLEEMSDPVFFWSAVATGASSSIGLATAGIAVGSAVGGPVGMLIGGVVGGAATSWSGPAIAAGIGTGGVVGGAVFAAGGLVVGGLAGAGLGYAQGAAQWKTHQSQNNDYRRSMKRLDTYGIPIADKQIEAASIQEEIATATLSIARLRAVQAKELAALVQNQFFNSSQLYVLAQQMREITKTYLRYAHEMAFLAEQALEYELNERINIIGFDYDHSQQLGLLGAERLQLDIASLKTARVERFDQKRLPVSISISLAEHFPLAFFDLIRHGHAHFSTDFSLFERLYPGAYQSRISRVELAFFALVPQQGLHGTLSSSGLSFVKNETGEVNALINPPEKMIVSQYEIRNGSAYFYDTREHFHPFEGMGLVTDWSLDLPPHSNQLNYNTIQDVQLVLHFTTLYSDDLADHVVGQLPPVEIAMRSFSVQNIFPNAFYHLHQDGQCSFALDNRHFPKEHLNGRIRKVMLFHVLKPEPTAAYIENSVHYEDAEEQSAEVALSLNLDPAVDSETSDESPFLGFSVYGEWNISCVLKHSDNSDLQDLSELQNILLFVEYEYEQARLRYRESFDTNILGSSQPSFTVNNWTKISNGGAQEVEVITSEPNTLELRLRNDGSENRWVPGPTVKADIKTTKITSDTRLSWQQLDRSHTLKIILTIVGADGLERKLSYAANASNKWYRQGWVDLYSNKGKRGPTYNTEEQFQRLIGADFLREYGVQADILEKIEVNHFSNLSNTNDHGAIIRNLNVDKQPWLPLQGNCQLRGGRLLVAEGLAVADIGIPDFYTIACRVTPRYGNGQIRFWAGQGRYCLALGTDQNHESGFYIYSKPYHGEEDKIEINTVAVEDNRWYWLKIQKWGKHITAFVDDELVAELTDEKQILASEIAVEALDMAVSFERILVS